jgi:hypothetical protein
MNDLVSVLAECVNDVIDHGRLRADKSAVHGETVYLVSVYRNTDRLIRVDLKRKPPADVGLALKKKGRK